MKHMYRSDPVPQSGLQQQPQRYSDRHQQQSSGSGDFQPRGWYAALQRRSIEIIRQPGDSRQDRSKKADRNLRSN